MKLIIKTLLPVFFGSAVLANSSFNEVRSILYDKSAPTDAAAVTEFSNYRSTKLPHYEVSMNSVFQFGTAALERAAKRTVSDHSDFLPRLPKLLHPNGVCVAGNWVMNKNSGFTGAFATGTKLFVGRISVALDNTRADADRGFGFAGKIFPTQDPDAAVATENFFTVDVLMGTNTRRFLDTATTNEPEIGFNIWLVRLGLKISSVLKLADENPGFRPVKNLAIMGTENSVQLSYPKWIRISAANGTIKNNQLDFRNEILEAVKDNQELVFNVDGSNTTKNRKATTGWSSLGQIRISEAMISYGCDRQLHFSHPKLK